MKTCNPLIKLGYSFIRYCLSFLSLNVSGFTFTFEELRKLENGFIFQILTQLENAIKRDFLSANFETTSEFLDSSNSSACTSNSSCSPEIVSVLPCVPKTTAAVGLRLMEHDRSIDYLPHQRVEFQKEKREGNLMVISLFRSQMCSFNIILLNTK